MASLTSLINMKEEVDSLDAWAQSPAKGAEADNFAPTAGELYGDGKVDHDVQTSLDAWVYGGSVKFKHFDRTVKPLEIKFIVKHEQNLDYCGGYIKLLDCKIDQPAMHGGWPYNVMFSPDTYGPGNGKVLGNNESAQKGSRIEDWDFLPPMKIKNPEAYAGLAAGTRRSTSSLTSQKGEIWDSSRR